MTEPETRPQPDSPRRNDGPHAPADDDIELPPLPAIGDDETINPPPQPGADRSTSSLWRLLGSAILLGTIAGFGLFLWQRGSTEKQHTNWQHVAAAAEASGTSNHLIHVGAIGEPKALSSVEVTEGDLQREATEDVRDALVRNDVSAATAALQNAQRIPQVSNVEVQQPEIVPNSEIASAIKDGENELYQIELFDSCEEDGDVVEVLVNGAPFATVPIVHDGALLSVPLARGANTVTIRGVRDGGGGVTVAFRTSRGDFFARNMRVGQEYQLGVTVK